MNKNICQVVDTKLNAEGNNDIQVNVNSARQIERIEGIQNLESRGVTKRRIWGGGNFEILKNKEVQGEFYGVGSNSRLEKYLKSKIIRLLGQDPIHDN